MVFMSSSTVEEIGKKLACEELREESSEVQFSVQYSFILQVPSLGFTKNSQQKEEQIKKTC